MENSQSTQLGQRIAEMLRDVPTHSALAAMGIASALLREHHHRPLSTFLDDSNDAKSIPVGSGEARTG